MRRVQSSKLKASAAAKPSVIDWLNQAPAYFSDADKDLLRAKVAGQIRREHEATARRMRELETELARLGATPVPPPPVVVAPAPVAASGSERPPVPSADWSILRIVKHYLASHPSALATDIAAHVLTVRPNEAASNVHSALYKYSKGGRPLRKIGEKGSYRFSLAEGE
jgi:hypothetical protein